MLPHRDGSSQYLAFTTYNNWYSGQGVQFLSHQSRESFPSCFQNDLSVIWQTLAWPSCGFYSGLASVSDHSHKVLID